MNYCCCQVTSTDWVCMGCWLSCSCCWDMLPKPPHPAQPYSAQHVTSQRFCCTSAHLPQWYVQRHCCHPMAPVSSTRNLLTALLNCFVKLQVSNGLTIRNSLVCQHHQGMMLVKKQTACDAPEKPARAAFNYCCMQQFAAAFRTPSQ